MQQVKRAFKCRFYPADEQAAELSRTFGCVRLVYNKALEERTRAWYGEQRRISYVESSAALTHREPTTVTVSCDSAGRWFVSLLCEDTIIPAPATTAAVGIDAGITSLVTLSTGEKISNPRHERRDRARLAKAQRELSRKAKGSANREKARRKVARVHARIADRRRDFLHKLSTRLVREDQTVVIEDLTVRNLLKNGKLARAISDAAWTEPRSMPAYKCAWYGLDLVVIDRWSPGSKPCGNCGTVRGRLPLNVREWTCDCGAVHDRDVNAARNILTAGLAASACGDGVRPQRESSRTGRSSVKQEPQRATAGIPRL
ncbi:RNA-guided endonuclease InsQ/TnpB family protein [Streptosporangium sandarakinum]|uniref:IS605 OrfB family transposase n=1 Tax=Streptosporangium sandarakinum TaxID=1260955 RepID=A0A852UZF8_9ACTN|nr:RNA-guided endonuclease TnpB family protein [Streptosporangium sandarakinum]NYF40523.1 IS605 OrfB family transposase [Streptosporangium sandarakinum]